MAIVPPILGGYLERLSALHKVGTSINQAVAVETESHYAKKFCPQMQYADHADYFIGTT
jgi:hypothetical protein